MSDLSINNDAWLSKLRSHLDAESYTVGTVSQYLGVARWVRVSISPLEPAVATAVSKQLAHTYGCIAVQSRSPGKGRRVWR